MNLTQAKPRLSATGLPGDSPAPLESVLCTEELNRRPSRPPDYQMENQALAALVKALADSPGAILQTLADTILEVFHADSAGLSLLTTHDGGKRFTWPAIAGAWKRHVGGGTPRDFGPCGDVLDRNAPLLFKRFERRYRYLLPATPPAEEALLIPFSVHGKAVGTIWAMAHDDRRRFDAEDLRQLTSLGRFASAAYQAVEHQQADNSRRAALNLMEDAVQSRQAAETLNVQLRENERRFREMIDALPAAVYTTDAEGHLTHFNPAAVEFSGRTPELGTGQWCVSWKLYRPDGTLLPHDECPMAIALKEGREVRGAEAIAERPDGKRIWFQPYPTPLRDAQGRVTGGINMLVDITERKQAEAALRESEALFATVVDQAPNGMYVVDARFRVQQVNSRARPVFGAVHPLIGRDFSEVIQLLWGPEVGGQVARIFRHTLETGERYISPDFSERRHDLGVEQSYEWEVQRVTLPDGEHRVICYFTDITDRKRAEEAVARMAAIITSSDDAIISKDLDGIIASWNQGAERLFGYTDQETVGQPASMLIPPGREDEEPRILERIRRGETTRHYETVHRRKDGSLIDVSLTVSPIKDAQGRIIGASKIVRDIAERKQAEAEVKASLEKTVLLNEIHHRVKNNLQVIDSLLDLQAAHIEDRAALAALRDSQHRVKSMALIHQTLYQSRDFARVNFGSFTKTLTQYLRDAYPAGAERVALRLKAADVLLPLNTAIPCGLIVNELVSNALKHAFPGEACGEVRVEVAHVAEGVLIAVSDNGAGIPPDRNLETDATLGLQLIRLLAEQVGATLEIRRGEPTRFALSVPVEGEGDNKPAALKPLGLQPRVAWS